MPIQFRCQYCRQLLGISRSRAGAVVDCPACGRTLKVPLGDDVSEAKGPEQSADSDSGLLTALEELSLLSLDSTGDVQGTDLQSQGKADKPRQKSLNIEEQQVDSLRIVPLSGSHFTSDTTPSAIQQSSAPSSADFVDSYAESLHEVAADSAGEPVRIFASIDSVPRSAWFRMSLIGAFIAATGFVSGFIVGVFRTGHEVLRHGTAEDPEPEKPPADETDLQPAGISVRLSGRVLYTDQAGYSQRDSESLVLLLPMKNTSGFRMDATSLRDPASTPAKDAVAAALAALNGSFARADSEGKFALDRRTAGAMKLIVVSRHLSRSDGEGADPKAAATLAEWFTNPTQLFGRLQLQEQVVPEYVETDDTPTEPIEIVFGAR